MYIMKKDHKQRRSFRLGLRAKILGVSLPVTIIMVIVMIAIAYNVSEAFEHIGKGSEQPDRSMAKP